MREAPLDLGPRPLDSRAMGDDASGVDELITHVPVPQQVVLSLAPRDASALHAVPRHWSRARTVGDNAEAFVKTLEVQEDTLRCD